MLTTQTDIKRDVIVKLGITTTIAFYTDDILDDWVRQAHRWAISYKKWVMTEGRTSTTYSSALEEYEFEGYKSDSIRFLEIGGKRFDKIDFESYKIFKEEQASSSDKVYTDFGRLVIISPNTDASGTLTVYGQYTPADPDMTGSPAGTVFSGGEEEGNTAIVEEVLSYAKTREKKLNDAEFHHQRAIQLLDNIDRYIDSEQFNYHTKDRGMFKRIDVVEGGFEDELFKRNQFT